MQNKILQLTKQFISIKSLPEDKKALDKILGLALSQLRGFTIERFEKNGVKSALIYNSKTRPKKFKIILNAHLDIIPGKENQYVPRVKNNKLYGVGSMDMKASVVCMIEVFKEVVKKVNYPLGLQLVTDEEIGGFNGTKYQIEKGVRADFVISGEPTNFDIVYKAKGILWLKVSARGKSAHSAYPWRGKNAVWKMNEFLNILGKKFPSPKKERWVITVNLSKIETTNNSFNKIPDDCTIWLDIRYMTKDARMILRDIRKILPAGFSIKVMEKEPILLVNSKNEYIKTLQKVSKQIINKNLVLRGANGSSDARHYAQINCPSIEFGPVGGEIGSDNEWVDILSLEKYCNILKKFLFYFT